MKNASWKQLYQKISSKIIEATVKPTLLGELHRAQDNSATKTTQSLNIDPSKPVCYVLQEYSKTNALVASNEAKLLGLPDPLAPMDSMRVHEDSSIIFLNKSNDQFKTHKAKASPRLGRLIAAVQQYSDFDVQLVPVSVLWGRSPDEEDSLLKLFFTDSWGSPTVLKQMINIGLHGNQHTYVEFHSPISLKQLAEESSGENISDYVTQVLVQYLAKQRALMVGPDMSDRRNVMGKLLKSDGIQQAIRAEMKETGETYALAEAKAKQYLDEIVTDYTYANIRIFDKILTWLWTQLYDGVEVYNFSQVRKLAEDFELIYTPSHRSHIDYMLLSYVVFKRGLQAPYIAGGDNLNLPVIGKFLRGSGAFFIRRSFRGNMLYTAVMREYIYSIVSRDTAIMYFIEGGRSRTGRLLSPKMGMLGMTVHAYLRPHSGKPIVFIPTYFGYERLMEGSTYVGEMNGKPKEAETVFGLLKSLRKIERIFGKVYVSFGEPVYLDQVLRANHVSHVVLENNTDAPPESVKHSVEDAALQIMTNINCAAVVNPVDLLSLVLLSAPKQTLDEQLCVAQINTYKRLHQLSQYDQHTEMTALSGKEVVNYGLKLKMAQRLQHVMGDMIGLDQNQAVLSTYFRNNILHVYMLPSFIAALVIHNGRIAKTELERVIQSLYPFLQTELFLKWQPEQLPHAINQVLSAMVSEGLILTDAEDGEGFLFSPEQNSIQHKQLDNMSNPIYLSLERYFITLKLLSQRGSGVTTTKDLEDLSHLLGQRLSIMYEFHSPEFFDRNLFKTFIQELTKQGYISLDDEKRVLFDHRIDDIANDASLVLDVEALNSIQHVTAVSEADMQAAMNELAAKQRSKKSS